MALEPFPGRTMQAPDSTPFDLRPYLHKTLVKTDAPIIRHKSKAFAKMSEV